MSFPLPLKYVHSQSRRLKGSIITLCVAVLTVFLMSILPIKPAFPAVFETPTGKRVPVKIIEKGEDTYTVETESASGRKIILTVEKDKIDLHGTAPGEGRIEGIKGNVELKRGEMPRFSRAYKGMVVNPGDEIRTGPK